MSIEDRYELEALRAAGRGVAGSVSAPAEHTVVITAGAPLVLTA